MPKKVHTIFIIVAVFLISIYLSNQYMLHPKEAKALNSRATTSVMVMVVCGDGLKDTGEICDKGSPPQVSADYGTSTCQDYGFLSGSLGCNDDCTQVLVDLCYTCGNGVKETAEECDGTDFGGKDCVSLGYNRGSLSCTSMCRINLMDCVSVGNTGGVNTGGGIGGGGSSGGGSSGFDIGRDTPLPTTKVIIKGTAYPESDVHILKDGAVLGVAKADTAADFNYENTAITPGVANFGFWSEDKNKLRSPLYALTFRISSNAVTTISGVYIPPTIGADKVTLKQGEDITIFGTAVPFTDIYVEIHSEENIERNLKSDDDGEWSLIFNTQALQDNVSHLAKSYFQKTASGATIKSGYSSAVSFYLGQEGARGSCPGADLNKDGRVNLTDFSIVLYYWGTNDDCADQNQNGRVELTDFSIMMYYWTG